MNAQFPELSAILVWADKFKSPNCGSGRTKTGRPPVLQSLAWLILLSLGPRATAQPKEQTTISFHGISVGQPVSTLPLGCSDKTVDCEGLIDGYYFRVDLENAAVFSFDVIYDSERLYRLTSATPVTSVKPITLAQALKLHSLQGNTRTPRLEYAQDVTGGIYGIVDATNHILYDTASSPTSNSLVKDVGYLSSTAPVLQWSSHTMLKESDAAAFLVAARNATRYETTATKPQPCIYLSAQLRIKPLNKPETI